MSTTKTAATLSAAEPTKESSAPASPLSMGLGQQLGNQYLQMLLQARMMQAKLSVSHPQDAFEHEADRVADQIMCMPAPTQSPRISAIRDDSALHRASASAMDVPTVDAATEHSIQSLSGRGSALPDAVRSYMEPRFSANFSAVRVHTDAHAHELARSVNAQAFTVGPHVVFGAGRYSPDTEGGKRLLAHELTHVVQQASAPRLDRKPETAGAVTPAFDTPFKDPFKTGPTIEDWATGVIDISAMDASALRPAIDELEQWVERQNGSSITKTRIEATLPSLHRELRKRYADTKPPVGGRRDHKAPAKVATRPTRSPRVLTEKNVSVGYANLAEARAEFDLIMRWLTIPDLSKQQRSTLLKERVNLEWMLRDDRQHAAGERHAARVRTALTSSDKDPRAALMSVVRTVEGITADPQNKEISYIYHQGERIAISTGQALKLRKDMERTLRVAASNIWDDIAQRALQDRARQVRSNEEYRFASRVSEIFTGNLLSYADDPYEKMLHRNGEVFNDLHTLRKHLDAGHLTEAAALLPHMETRAREMAQMAEEFTGTYTRGAERAITVLEITARAAVTIELGLLTAGAASWVSGVVAGARLTGVSAGAATLLGTGTVVGFETAAVRSGVAFTSTLAATHSVADAWRDSTGAMASGFLEGLLTGATGGAARVLAPVLGVGANVGYQAARRAGAEAIANGTAGVISAIVKGKSIPAALKEGMLSAGLAIPGAWIGGGSGKRLLAGALAAHATTFAHELADGASLDEAIEAASMAMVTHLVASKLGHETDAALVRRGQRVGKAIKNTAKAVKTTATNATAAIAIGIAKPLPHSSFERPRIELHDDTTVSGTRLEPEQQVPTPAPVLDSQPRSPGVLGVDDQAVPEVVDNDSVTQKIQRPNSDGAAESHETTGAHRKEKVGDITIIGTRQMEGTTLHREVPGLFNKGGARRGIGQIFRLCEYLIADAKAAGATRLRITGKFIGDANVLRINRLARKYGGTARRTGAREIEIDIPLMESGEIDGREISPRTENATVTSDRTAAVDHEALGTRSNDDEPLRVKDPDEQAPARLTERNAMDTGDGGRRGKPDSDPLAPMPRTGRKSPERLFELLEKGGSRKLKQATVEGQAKNRPESGVFRRGLTSPKAAYRAFNKALAGSAGREVGIFYNTETGEYAVIIDSAVKVSAPENESGWIGLVHFHHNEFNSWVLRLPSPRSDFSDLWARTRSENERVREFVEWNDPRGGRGRTELGIDLAWPEKPIYVRIIEPSGKQWIERFKTEADYHRYYDSHTKFVEPESALHDWVLSGARRSSTDPDEAAGASSQRTAIDPVGGQAPGTGPDLAMLNRARSAIAAKLSEMLLTNKVVERFFTVEHVRFGALSVKLVENVLIISIFDVRKVGPTPRGHGSRIMQAFEKAAVDVGLAQGARRVRREAPYVVYADWADELTNRGYKPMGGDGKTKGGSTPQAGKDLKSGGDKKTEGESKPQRLVLEIELPGSSGRTPKRPPPAPPASKVSGQTPLAPPPTRGTGVRTGEIHAPDAAPPEKRGTRVPTESEPKVVVEDPVMTERARSHLRGALRHLLSTGRKEIVRVEGVIFGVVEVRLLESNSKAEPGSGPALEVSYLTISKTQVGATIPGRGVLMHGVLEEAARDIGRIEGAVSVSVRVDAVENEVFAHELRTRGYKEVDDKSTPGKEVKDESTPGKKVEGKSTPRSVNLRRELVSPPQVQPPAESGKGPPPLDVGLTWRTYRRNSIKPVVDQLRVNSPDRLEYCGPACAAMLLQELGWQPNIETLAKKLWSGMTATNLAAALRAHGLPSAHVASPTVGDIERAVQGGRTPAIAVMSEPGTTGLHWVVVDGFTTRPEFGPGIFVAIRDPYGASQYFVSRADFARRLAGGEMVLTDPLVKEPPPARPKK